MSAERRHTATTAAVDEVLEAVETLRADDGARYVALPDELRRGLRHLRDAVYAERRHAEQLVAAAQGLHDADCPATNSPRGRCCCDSIEAGPGAILDTPAGPPCRRPYVGDGADGARRSAEVDRNEADTLDRDDPRRDELLASADRWEEQAAQLEADA